MIDTDAIRHIQWTSEKMPAGVVQKIEDAAAILRYKLQDRGIVYTYHIVNDFNHLFRIGSCVVLVHGIPGRFGELKCISMDIHLPEHTCVRFIENDVTEEMLIKIDHAVATWAFFNQKNTEKKNSIDLAAAINKLLGEEAFSIANDDSITCFSRGLTWEQALKIASVLKSKNNERTNESLVLGGEHQEQPDDRTV